jgi:KDO2-lipid IV(A) lauroyltransferase
MVTPMHELAGTAAARPAREPGQAKYWAYRAAVAVVPHVPAPAARLAAELAGLAAWALAAGARRRVDANLAHIPALAADPERRRAAVRGVFRTAALNYLDQFRVPYLSDAEIAATWEVGRADLFEAAVARGRGIILLTAHMGAFEHAGARTGLLGIPLTLPMERLKPAALFEVACALRCHHGIRAIPADSPATVRELYAALKRGEGVILAIDRDVLGTGVEVPFFGAPARLPIGPAILARRSGATMLWASGVRGPRGSSPPPPPRAARR